MSEGPQRIALFGGTFDPIHQGHVVMARVARESLELDRVILIPCAISPHKGEGEMPAPGVCRMDMIRIACAEYPWMDADASELEREGVSYSWQTAEDFSDRFPDARLFWILGEDQWRALPRWSHPERLGSLVEFIVFGRNHSEPTLREGYKAWFLPEVHEASATQIRNVLETDVKAGEMHPWLVPGVFQYIRERGLYGVGQ
jgi:nicotinate-nucleotide adenylyltransferase